MRYGMKRIPLARQVELELPLPVMDSGGKGVELQQELLQPVPAVGVAAATLFETTDSMRDV
jgi:hypothetical protein